MLAMPTLKFWVEAFGDHLLEDLNVWLVDCSWSVCSNEDKGSCPISKSNRCQARQCVSVMESAWDRKVGVIPVTGLGCFVMCIVCGHMLTLGIHGGLLVWIWCLPRSLLCSVVRQALSLTLKPTLSAKLIGQWASGSTCLHHLCPSVLTLLQLLSHQFSCRCWGSEPIMLAQQTPAGPCLHSCSSFCIHR